MFVDCPLFLVSTVKQNYNYVVLYCSDGIGRTGTFICIHAQLERVRTEGVIDIFEFVKSLRISRSNLVSELVSRDCVQ